MKLDRWIALILLCICLVYGYAAFTYELLPFERNMEFLPTTLPKILAITGALFSTIILLSPSMKGEDGEVLGHVSKEQLRAFHLTPTIALIAAMFAYALALRPVGFIPSTVLFLVSSGTILGERKFHWLIPVALIGAGFIWYLVDQVLGIYLKPWPWFV